MEEVTRQRFEIDAELSHLNAGQESARDVEGFEIVAITSGSRQRLAVPA